MKFINPLRLLQDAAAEVAPIYSTLLLVLLPTTLITVLVRIFAFPDELEGLPSWVIDFFGILTPPIPPLWIVVISILNTLLIGFVTTALKIILSYQQVQNKQVGLSEAFEVLKSRFPQFLLLSGLFTLTSFVLSFLLIFVLLFLGPTVGPVFLWSVFLLLNSYCCFIFYPVLVETENAWSGFIKAVGISHTNLLTVLVATSVQMGINQLISTVIHLIVAPSEVLGPILQPLFWLQDPITQARLIFLIQTGINYFIAPIFVMYFLLLYLRLRPGTDLSVVESSPSE